MECQRCADRRTDTWHRRVIAGLCGRCGLRPHGDGRATCVRCRDWQDPVRRLLGRLHIRQGGVCPWCEMPLPDDPWSHGDDGRALVHVDHVVPRSAGGGDDLGNLRALHAECNQSRQDGPVLP